MRVEDIIVGNSEWYDSGTIEVEPEVSIILPTYNRAGCGFFERAVISALNQTFKVFELIIVDDASTDETFSLIEKFMKLDNRVKCIRHKRNVGLPAIGTYEAYLKSKGKYIAFLFDDNEWKEEFLFKTYMFMERTGLKATYGKATLMYDVNGIKKAEYGNPENVGGIDFLFTNNFIGNAGVVLHRDVIETVGLYDPHLALTSLCDWDLWRRVRKKYRFVSTGIDATTEWGASLTNSIGNTNRADYWFALERMAEHRDAQLRPENFHLIDIVAVENDNTKYYKENLEAKFNQKKDKFWHNQTDFGCVTGIEKMPKKKRVLILHIGMSASISLNFVRVFERTQNIVVRYVQNKINEEDWLLADVVIFTRLAARDEDIERFNQLDVPCYYFTDDNFVELSKEFPEDPFFRYLSRHMTSEKLARYRGMIVSSEKLKEYCLKNNLHYNVIVLPVIIDEYSKKPGKMESHNTLRIGFLGGLWRRDVLLSTVLPAIQKLSMEIQIEFYIAVLPGEEERKKYAAFCTPNLQIHYTEINSSVDMVLNEYAGFSLDILVHCGQENSNNIYKTENALVNATQLGAVLLVSNVEPYSNSKAKEKAFLTTENTIEGWNVKLKELTNKENRERLLMEAESYCYMNYSADKRAVDLFAELDDLSECSLLESYRRARQITETLLKNNSRKIADVPLSLSRLIKNNISYNIICPVNELKEIGVLFGCFEKSYAGDISIQIKLGKRLLQTVNMSLDAFLRDDWTYIPVEPMNNMRGKILTLRFEVAYQKGSGHIGFFENLERRDFVYKVCNKLGMHINGLEALYTDCR